MPKYQPQVHCHIISCSTRSSYQHCCNINYSPVTQKAVNVTINNTHCKPYNKIYIPDYIHDVANCSVLLLPYMNSYPLTDVLLSFIKGLFISIIVVSNQWTELCLSNDTLETVLDHYKGEKSADYLPCF